LRYLYWISIRKLKQHEFHTTLRKLGNDENTWRNRFSVLEQIEAKAIKVFVRNLGLLVLAHLILTSLRDGATLSINVQNFTAQVPVSYFLAIVSFQMLLVAVSFCHLTVATSLRVKEAGKILLSGFSASTFGLLTQRKTEDMTLGTTLYANYFFKEIFPVSIILAMAFLLGLAVALLPTIAFGISIFTQQLTLLLHTDILLLERISIVCGIFLLTLSSFYVVLFQIPLPMKKSKSSIRWNFLWQIRLTEVHPQAESWLRK
jgi:hypothetical protein